MRKTKPNIQIQQSKLAYIVIHRNE